MRTHLEDRIYGCLLGGLIGAYRGASGLPPHWVAKVEANSEVPYRTLTPALAAVVRARAARTVRYAQILASLE